MPRGERLAEHNHARGARMRAAHLTNYTEDKVSGCWLWLGGVSSDGYGKVKHERKTWRAHRLFYTLLVGAIPDSLLVCHKCDNPLCVNPEHLFVGTHLDNERDKDAKSRRPPSPSVTHPHKLLRGEAHHKSKLTSEAVVDIRTGGKPSRFYAEKYGVSMSAVQRAKNGTFWRHV